MPAEEGVGGVGGGILLLPSFCFVLSSGSSFPLPYIDDHDHNDDEEANNFKWDCFFSSGSGPCEVVALVVGAIPPAVGTAERNEKMPPEKSEGSEEEFRYFSAFCFASSASSFCALHPRPR